MKPNYISLVIFTKIIFPEKNVKFSVKPLILFRCCDIIINMNWKVGILDKKPSLNRLKTAEICSMPNSQQPIIHTF